MLEGVLICIFWGTLLLNLPQAVDNDARCSASPTLAMAKNQHFYIIIEFEAAHVLSVRKRRSICLKETISGEWQ